MSEYDPTNRGALFDNDRKESETHPDMKGKLNVGGVEHWFSAWWKESKTGTQYLSLCLGKPVEQQAAQEEPRQVQRPPQGNRPPPRQNYGGHRG
jgi:hypothetical protein